MEWYVIPLFIVGLLCLIKGGDWFVDGASGIAKRFKIPEILIGATIVSAGTTLPEVMVSATSAAQGSGGIAFGNAIGSIICNTALIAAVTVAIKPGKADRKTMIIPVAFFFGSAIYYSLIAYFGTQFSRISGIILLLTFAAYMSLNVVIAKGKAKETCTDGVDCQCTTEVDTGAENGVADEGKKGLVKEIIMIAVGAVLIAVGARLLVDNATVMAKFFGMSEAIIGLTIVALGTSLPEFVTAVTSLIKGHSSLSLGNIIGANLFNIVFVSGVSITISPFSVPEEDVLANGMLASLAIDIPVMLGVMLILTVPTLIRGKLSRVQGISLLAIYAGYIALRMILV